MKIGTQAFYRPLGGVIKYPVEIIGYAKWLGSDAVEGKLLNGCKVGARNEKGEWTVTDFLHRFEK